MTARVLGPGEHTDGTRVFIQWKGTNVCLDFWCACGVHLHHDGDFAYRLECPDCGRMWEMPSSFALEESKESFGRGEYEVSARQDAHPTAGDDGSRLVLASECPQCGWQREPAKVVP